MHQKTKFTMQQHLATADVLFKVKDEIFGLIRQIEATYGPKFEASRDLFEALEKINNARRELDSVICREHPLGVDQVDGIPLVRVYLGDPNDPARRRNATG
jgi:hypothetical protein